MSQYKEKLNSYELRYFQKFFGTNIKRLLSLRKSLTKKIHDWYWYDCYILLSFRRSLQNVGSECTNCSVTTFDYV